MTFGFYNWDLFKPPGVLVTVQNMHILITQEDPSPQTRGKPNMASVFPKLNNQLRA